MSKRRASILAIRSVITLRSGKSSYIFKNDVNEALDLSRSLSNVAEREEYQSGNGYSADNSLQDYQNHGEFNCNSQNHMYSQQHGQSSGSSRRENSDGFYSENSIDRACGRGHVPRKDFVNSSVVDETAIRSHGQNYGGLPPNSHGFNQKHNWAHRDTYGNSHNANQVGNNGRFVDHRINNGQSHNGFNLDNPSSSVPMYNNGVSRDARYQSHNIQVEHRENFNAYNGYNNGEMQQNTNGVYGQNSCGRWTENRQHNLNELIEGNGDKHKAYGSYHEGFKQTRQDSNVFNLGELSGSQSNHHMGNVGKFQSSDQMNQQRVGTYQQNPNAGRYNHVTGPNYHNPMPGPINQNPISGQFQQKSISGQYPQNHYYGQYQPSAAIEQYQPNPNTTQSCVTKDRQHSGTLEELDEYCKEGKLQEAVEVLELLEKQHIHVDSARYIQLMCACGEAKSLQEAKAVYHHAIKSQSPLELSTYNKILEMYSKCGSMDDAYMVFNKMPNRNVTSWTTMITWLAKNDLGEDAIDLFYEFKKSGQRPDGKMLIGVFSACSVLGDADEGMLHFESMSKSYGVIPSMDHYVSIVDMLGSVGYVDEALEFIEKMPLEPGVDIWETMMNISRAHGLVELGDCCAELVEKLDSTRLNEQSKAGLVPVKASDLAKEKEKKKLANQNILEVRSRVHEYRAGDTSHPENNKIYTLLRGMREQMKEAGYIPEPRFVLHDIDPECKNDALLGHSERLAVAYGLLSSSARSPIRVIKNLRVCGDCHTALKIISKIVGRELIIRDAKRFHHFKDGLCSCHDYW